MSIILCGEIVVRAWWKTARLNLDPTLPPSPPHHHTSRHTQRVPKRCLKIKENRPVSRMYRDCRSERRKAMKNGWEKKSTSPPPGAWQTPHSAPTHNPLSSCTHTPLSAPLIHACGVCKQEDEVGTQRPRPLGVKIQRMRGFRYVILIFLLFFFLFRNGQNFFPSTKGSPRLWKMLT